MEQLFVKHFDSTPFLSSSGGNVHQHQTPSNINQPLEHEKCYEHAVEMYHLGCQQWVEFDDLAKEFQGEFELGTLVLR